MGLQGKLVSQTKIRSDGNVFHDLFTRKLHQLPTVCPHMFERICVERGHWGTVGSVIDFHFIHDGEKKFARETIEAIDEKKKSVTFNIIEGDINEAYKTFKLTIDVDINTYEDHLVTMTIAYEKKTADVPAPHSLMDFCVNCTKAIERHCLLVPN